MVIGDEVEGSILVFACHDLSLGAFEQQHVVGELAAHGVREADTGKLVGVLELLSCLGREVAIVVTCPEGPASDIDERVGIESVERCLMVVDFTYTEAVVGIAVAQSVTCHQRHGVQQEQVVRRIGALIDLYVVGHVGAVVHP